MTFIGEDCVEGFDESLIMSCPNCRVLKRFDRPDDWITNGAGYYATQAKKEGRSLKLDPKVAQNRIDEVSEAIINFPIDKMGTEELRVLTMQVTVLTFLQNLRSNRPSVRQRAGESLARYTMQMPTAKLEVSEGDLSKLSPAELSAKTSAVLARYQELQAKAGRDTDA